MLNWVEGHTVIYRIHCVYRLVKKSQELPLKTPLILIIVYDSEC